MGHATGREKDYATMPPVKKYRWKASLRRWPDVAVVAKPSKQCEREHVADALGAFIAAENGTLVRLLNGAAHSYQS